MRLVMMIASLALASCSSQERGNSGEGALDHSEAPVSAQLPSQALIDAAKAELAQEPKVIDLVYDAQAAVEWTIGVKDDGSQRFGLAEYLCGRLADLGASTDMTTVRIVDYRKFMAPGGNGRDASLGTVECSNLAHSTP